MLIFRLSTLITFVLLSGCASSPEKLTEPETSPAPVQTAEPKQTSKPQDVKTAIDPDVLFMLLTAELAGQRGQYNIALEGYLEAAKRVHDPRFAERAAMIAMYLKDSTRTNEAVNIWLGQDANNLVARKFAALSALRAGDKTAAVTHIETLLKNDPAGFEKALLELAAVLQKEHKAALVFEVLDTVSNKHPDQAVVAFVEALLAIQMNKGDVAEAKLAQALRIQPNWDKALMLQAQLALFSGDFNKAKSELKIVAAKFPEDNKIKKLLAQVLIKTKDYHEAAQIYQAILKANPKENDSRFALGLVDLQLDKDDEAEELFKELLIVDELRSQASFYLGKLEEKRDNVAKALIWYDKVNDEPLAFEASLAAIALLEKDKQFAEAQARITELAKKFPQQKVRILLVQSELLNQQQEYGKAFALLSNALVDLPDDKDLLYTHALMAEHVGKLDVLEADLRKILKQHPDNAEALNALGYTLTDKTNRYDEAEAYLLHALKIAPDEPVILDSYGWLQFKRGNTVKALDYLQRAYAKQQENEIAAHLAEVLWVLNRKDEARKIIKDALKDAPDDQYLLNFKARVLDKAE